jgi:hypothetical protein
MFLDKSVTAEERRDYFVDVFDGLTVGDVLSIVPAIKDSEKVLFKDILLPIVITDVVDDIFGSN